MKISGITALLFVALLALAGAAFLAIGRERTWALLAGSPDLGRYEFSTLKRRKTPNDALMCSPGLCKGASDGPLPVFDEPPEEVMKKINRKIAASGKLVRRVDDGSDPSYARYVTFTPWMRFPDTTDIQAIRMADGHTGLRAYARAQLGSSDGGVNEARLKRWLAAK
jgi:hypothetical protein